MLSTCAPPKNEKGKRLLVFCPRESLRRKSMTLVRCCTCYWNAKNSYEGRGHSGNTALHISSQAKRQADCPPDLGLSPATCSISTLKLEYVETIFGKGLRKKQVLLSTCAPPKDEKGKRLLVFCPRESHRRKSMTLVRCCACYWNAKNTYEGRGHSGNTALHISSQAKKAGRLPARFIIWYTWNVKSQSLALYTIYLRLEQLTWLSGRTFFTSKLVKTCN
jgi:hypothetical protein